jgi:membrane protein implicated in regulation of membrane protease activity
MSKVTVARALTARIARRFVKIGDIIMAASTLVLLVIVGALAYFFSPWWWLLLLPILLVVGIFLIVRLIVAVIISRVQVGKLTTEQRKALDDFTDKIQQIIEARATPLPIVAIICIKDILFHRDVTTIKKTISDSVGLRRDYQNLEKLF